MKQSIQLGRGKGLMVVMAWVLACVACPLTAAAQANGEKAPPALPPPAAAPQVAKPAEPSMMPRTAGDELDRVVAIVNDDLILDSDVNEELRLQEFDPYRNPSETISRDRAIERLINRDLILQQLKLQPAEQVSDSEVTKRIEQLRKDIPACTQYDCQTKAGWDRFLSDHGFTEATFFKRWKQRMDVLEFIEERFQMGVNITPAQIKDYYEKVLLPEYQRRHAPAPPLDSISSRIQEILLQQKITNLLGDWLQSLRAQGKVVVLHPGEEAP